MQNLFRTKTNKPLPALVQQRRGFQNTMQDTEKKRKPGSGGKREGSGRKKGIEKPVVAITIDQVNKDWVDEFGIGRSFSDKVNRILTTHRERIEQMDRDANEVI